MINKDCTCETCVKSDVCNIAKEFKVALRDIEAIYQRPDVYMSVTTRCEKYAPIIKTTREALIK